MKHAFSLSHPPEIWRRILKAGEVVIGTQKPLGQLDAQVTVLLKPLYSFDSAGFMKATLYGKNSHIVNERGKSEPPQIELPLMPPSLFHAQPAEEIETDRHFGDTFAHIPQPRHRKGERRAGSGGDCPRLRCRGGPRGKTPACSTPC